MRFIQLYCIFSHIYKVYWNKISKWIKWNGHHVRLVWLAWANGHIRRQTNNLWNIMWIIEIIKICINDPFRGKHKWKSQLTLNQFILSFEKFKQLIWLRNKSRNTNPMYLIFCCSCCCFVLMYRRLYLWPLFWHKWSSC